MHLARVHRPAGEAGIPARRRVVAAVDQEHAAASLLCPERRRTARESGTDHDYVGRADLTQVAGNSHYPSSTGANSPERPTNVSITSG